MPEAEASPTSSHCKPTISDSGGEVPDDVLPPRPLPRRIPVSCHKKSMMASLEGILVQFCAQAFVIEATKLALTSKAIAALLPMGTGRQFYEAAKRGDDAALATYIEYWRKTTGAVHVVHWINKSEEHMTPLAAAVANNHPKCVRLLLEVPAPKRYIPLRGIEEAPLYLAVQNGLPEIVHLLLASYEYNIPQHIKHSKDIGSMQVLSLATVWKEFSALQFAAKIGQGEIVRMMIVAMEKTEHRRVRTSRLHDDDNEVKSLNLALAAGHEEVASILAEAIELKRLRNVARKILIDAAEQVSRAITLVLRPEVALFEFGIVDGEIHGSRFDHLRALLQTWRGNKAVLELASEYVWMHPPFQLLVDTGVLHLMLDTPGFDFECYADEGISVLGVAYLEGNAVVKAMLHSSGIILSDYDATKLLVRSVESRNLELLTEILTLKSGDAEPLNDSEYLLSRHYNGKCTVLIEATMHGYLEGVVALLATPGVEVNTVVYDVVYSRKIPWYKSALGCARRLGCRTLTPSSPPC